MTPQRQRPPREKTVKTAVSTGTAAVPKGTVAVPLGGDGRGADRDGRGARGDDRGAGGDGRGADGDGARADDAAQDARGCDAGRGTDGAAAADAREPAPDSRRGRWQWRAARSGRDAGRRRGGGGGRLVAGASGRSGERLAGAGAAIGGVTPVTWQAGAACANLFGGCHAAHFDPLGKRRAGQTIFIGYVLEGQQYHEEFYCIY